VSSRRGQLGVWIVHGTEEPTEIREVNVEPGETIDFVVDARGRDTNGGFTWSPVLRMASASNVASEKTLWDAAKDFKPPASTTPQIFDIWARYTQVLLESNEFLFLD
jgi:hypothetical protein